MQVKFNANTEYEMINNYKILQNAFNKLGIAKVRLLVMGWWRMHAGSIDAACTLCRACWRIVTP